MMSRLRLALLFTIALPSVASAHIQLVKPNARIPNGTNEQKTEHCGSPAWVRAEHPDRVTYFKPGETVRVMWQETVPHTGWYRIAFLKNGELFHVPPPGTAPGNFPTADMTGMTDPATGTLVLKDRVLDVPGTSTFMADVVLPTEECTNCTLQLTQFMTDSSPYTIDSIYFNCADIVISNNPPPVTGTPDAGPVTPTPDGGAPVDDGDVKGGCSTSGASRRAAR
jgi:hypothetical protein